MEGSGLLGGVSDEGDEERWVYWVHRVNNYIEEKATQIVFGWKFHEFLAEYEG